MIIKEGRIRPRTGQRLPPMRAQQASTARADMLCRDLLADCQVDSLLGGSSHKASIAAQPAVFCSGQTAGLTAASELLPAAPTGYTISESERQASMSNSPGVRAAVCSQPMGGARKAPPRSPNADAWTRKKPVRGPFSPMPLHSWPLPTSLHVDFLRRRHFT